MEVSWGERKSTYSMPHALGSSFRSFQNVSNIILSYADVFNIK